MKHTKASLEAVKTEIVKALANSNSKKPVKTTALTKIAPYEVIMEILSDMHTKNEIAHCVSVKPVDGLWWKVGSPVKVTHRTYGQLKR